MAEVPKAVICDLDGTLALLGGRSPYDASKAYEDTLNAPVANVLEVYAHQRVFPIELILITGREDKYRSVTEQWLKKHNITHYSALHMRTTGDRRKDYEVKRELFNQHIKLRYDVLFVLEDRDQVVKMWRDLGLTCFQVAYGNF